MPNPTGKGLKPNKPGERRGGRQAGTRDLRTLVREAAEETGLIERVPVLDKEGKPTGRYEFRYGAEGEMSTGMGAGIGQLHGPAAGLRAPYFGFKKGKH